MKNLKKAGTKERDINKYVKCTGINGNDAWY